MAKEFKYRFVDKENFDHIISEGGSGFVALRKVVWGVGEDEPYDEDKVRVDIRKYRIDPDGTEVMSKGCSLSEESAHELANTLVKAGYGDTKNILESLKERKDFDKIIPIVFTDDDVFEEDGEIYDPRKVLMG